MRRGRVSFDSIGSLDEPPEHPRAKSRRLSDALRFVEDHVRENPQSFLRYQSEDKPSWIFCAVIALQVVWSLIVPVNHLLTETRDFFCAPRLSNLFLQISSTFFISGVITFLQSVFGLRVSLTYGPSLTQTLLLNSIVLDHLNEQPSTCNEMSLRDLDSTEESFLKHLNAFQGALIISGIIQMLLGMFGDEFGTITFMRESKNHVFTWRVAILANFLWKLGLMGIFVKFFSPLVIGLSLVTSPAYVISGVAMSMAKNWPISIMTVLLLCTFSFILSDVKIPTPTYDEFKGWKLNPMHFFQIYSIHITTVIVLSVWYGLGLTPETDTVSAESEVIIEEVDDTVGGLWFRIPTPGQFGIPDMKFTMANIFTMLMITISTMMDAIAAFYNASLASGMTNPPIHAINRGIFVGGFGSVICGLFGTLGGTVPYKDTACYMSTIMVGCRRIGYCLGLILAIIGLSPRLSYLLSNLPDPFLGALACCIMAVMLCQGIAIFHYMDLGSGRNLFVLGTSVFLAMAVPEWTREYPNAMDFSFNWKALDEMVKYIIKSPLSMAFLLSFWLDNTVPGTDAERGITMWKENNVEGETLEDLVRYSPYSMPIGMNFILKNFRLTSQIPLCPVYNFENSLFTILQAFCSTLCNSCIKKQSPK